MTVLDGVNSCQVTPEPYPHLVLEKAIEDNLCGQLINEFPPLSVFTQDRLVGDNVKIYYPAGRALQDNRVSEVWKYFLREHLTRQFYLDVLRVFEPFIELEHPEFKGKLKSLRTGVAGVDSFRDCDVRLDALIGIHTPVAGLPRLERRPHVKGQDKFLEGFLYLRPDDDTAEGGDYEFFSVLPGCRPRFGRWAQTDRRNLRLDRTVPYRKNTLVIVVNTSRSIQALTPRGPGNRPLMYLNITVQLPRMLFDLDYTPTGRAHRFVRRLMDRAAEK